MLSKFATQACRRVSSQAGIQVDEIKIPMPWGDIAAKWWGPKDQRPILTIHGLMDNSGSFDTLIPLLPHDVSFLSIDVPGHGFSSRLPPGMVYHLIVDSLVYNRSIQKYFGWDKVSLMGHSMGAAISFMFAVTYPSEVDFLICLDYLKTEHLDNVEDLRGQKFDYFLKMNKQLEMEPLSYSYEELAKRYYEASCKSVDLNKVHYILNRNCMPSTADPEKYVLTRDPRLKIPIVYNLPHEEMLKSARKLKMPVLVTKNNRGVYFENKRYFYEALEEVKKSSKDFRFYRVDGTHHAHLNNPKVVSDYITNFLRMYYTG